MSARPALYGGYHASGIPTVITNHRRECTLVLRRGRRRATARSHSLFGKTFLRSAPPVQRSEGLLLLVIESSRLRL